GTGPESIVFAHGLLWNSRLYDPQVAVFKSRYRCITFDFRGQGQSEVTQDGYDMDTLAGDAAALSGALNAGPCHFVGPSMRGFVGLRLAIRRPDLLRSLTLRGSSADAEPDENVPRYKRMAFIARWLGIRLMSNRVMKIFFAPKFLPDPARAAEREDVRRRLIANHVTGAHRATTGVVNRQPVYDE